MVKIKPVTVGMLKSQLRNLPDDLVIVVELNDGEGNNSVINAEGFELKENENFNIVVDSNGMVEMDVYEDWALQLGYIDMTEDTDGINTKGFVVIELVGADDVA